MSVSPSLVCTPEVIGKMNLGEHLNEVYGDNMNKFDEDRDRFPFWCVAGSLLAGGGAARLPHAPIPDPLVQPSGVLARLAPL